MTSTTSLIPHSASTAPFGPQPDPATRKPAPRKSRHSPSTPEHASLRAPLGARGLQTAITITARPSAPVARNADGTILPKDSYKHESGFLLDGKIYNFTLFVPTTTPNVVGADKEALDKAIKLYKDKFIEYLKTEKDNKSILQSGKGFDIEFIEKGYTLKPVADKLTSAAATLQTQTAKEQTPEVTPVTVTTREAKLFSELLRTGQDAVYVTDLLKEEHSYPAAPKPVAPRAPVTAQPADAAKSSPVKKDDETPTADSRDNTLQTQQAPVAPTNKSLPKLKGHTNSCYLIAAIHTLASNPLILQELLKDGAIDKDHPLKTVLQQYKNPGQEPIDLCPLQAKIGLKAGVQKDAHETLMLLVGAVTPLKQGLILSSITQEWSYLNKGTELWRKVPGNASSLQLPMLHIAPGDSVAKLFEKQLIQEHKNPQLITIDGKKQVLPVHSKTSFQTAPNILMVHVQRSESTGAGKTDALIDAPVTVTLPARCIQEKPADTQYELTSFTRHLGSSAKSGHYLTYVKANDAYWEIDSGPAGTSTFESKLNLILPETFAAEAKTAYDLIYTKKASTVLSNSPSVKKLVVAPAPLTPPIKLNSKKGQFITKLRGEDDRVVKMPSIKDKDRNADWQINDDREISDSIWSDLKAHIALIILDSGNGVITFTSTQKNIAALRLYVDTLMGLSLDPEIKNEHISFKAEKGMRSLAFERGEKTFNNQTIAQLYTSLMEKGPNETGEGFDLCSKKSENKFFNRNAGQTNEQATLDNLLAAIRTTPLNGNKVYFRVSEDILIKNFEKITAAIKSAEDAYNVSLSNSMKNVLWNAASGVASKAVLGLAWLAGY